MVDGREAFIATLNFRKCKVTENPTMQLFIIIIIIIIIIIKVSFKHPHESYLLEKWGSSNSLLSYNQLKLIRHLFDTIIVVSIDPESGDNFDPSRYK